MGIDTTEYDFQVFRITSEIARQVFPVSLDTDHPSFRAGLERLHRISDAINNAKAQGSLIGKVKQAGWALAGAATFARLYFFPVKRHDLPKQVRSVPAW